MLTGKKLMERLNKEGFKTLVETIESNNDTYLNWNKDYALICGSSLMDLSNGVTLEKKYKGVERTYFMYGARGCSVSIEWLNSASGEELHQLDEDLKYLSNSWNYPLLDDDDYYSLQADIVESCIDDYNFSDEEKEAARDYLYGCSFYSDFIDYCESDLMVAVGREE